jgi:hypothetical protein
MIARVDGNGRSDEHFKRLDLSTIAFPSDGLCIGVLRQAHPDLFDHGFEEGHNAQPQFFFHSDYGGHAQDVVASMLYYERLVAVSAYADARGIDGPDCNLPEFIHELTKLYVRYRIESGPHQATELIRSIEQQGRALAKQRNA